MSIQPIDPAEFQESQRAAWSSVASGWSEWWDIFEQGASNLNRTLVDRSRAASGDRVLDIATGVAEPAVTAARTVGPTGSVLATDLSSEMLRFGVERAKSAGLDNIEFLECDAHELALEPGSFDAAVSRWGIMLMLDPSRVLENIHSALRPGATLAASVWGDPKSAPFLATPMRAARSVLDLEPPPADAPGPFRLCDEGALDALMLRAGFTEVEHESVTVHMNFASFREYRDFLGDLSSSFKRMLAELTEAERESVWAAVERETEPHQHSDGRVLFANQAWCVWGLRS